MNNNFSNIFSHFTKELLIIVLGVVIVMSLLISFPDRVSAAATSSSNPVVICIDPGHGGTGDRNLGAQYNGISEKEITLVTAAAMKAELEKYDNVKVYLTRNDDRYVSLQSRADYAKSVGADFLFSIHYNASADHLAYGSEIWVSAFGSYYQKGFSFAYNEMNELGVLGLYQRGIKTRIGNSGNDYYGIIRAATANNIPSCIIEHCYVDQATDLSYIKNTQNSYEALGKADATAVAKYFNLKSESLGKDYSAYQNITVSAPTTILYDDRTDPEVCTLKSASYNASTRKLSLNITAQDSGSPTIYYSYSTDGGNTFSSLNIWDRTKTTDTVSVSLNSKPASVVVRAYNQYDFYKQSSVVNVK